jgi:hypothetical protein
LIPHFGKRKAISVIGAVVVTISIAAILPSTELSINKSCDISGPAQKLKLAVQGKRYWAKQLELLDDEVRDIETHPERMRRLQIANEGMSEILEKHRQSMEELYSKFPELRPSPQQTLAQELRKRADAIEGTWLQERMNEVRTQRLLALEACRGVIADR